MAQRKMRVQPKRIVIRQSRPSVWEPFRRAGQVMTEIGIIAGRMV